MTHTVAKLQPWRSVRCQVETLVKTLDPEDVTVMLPYGLQLIQSFCHPHVLRCMAFYHSTKGSTFVTHIDSGAGHVMYTWTVSSLDELKVHCEKFPIQSAITNLLSVPQHRVFIGYCSDMTLRVFSDVLHKCSELSRTATPISVLCIAYNEDMDELITGGHGCLQTWNMDRVELRDPLTPGRPINCEIGPDDWVRDIQVFQKQRQLVALCNEGVFMVDYLRNQQLFHMPNWHATALTSFVWYRPLEYFITASMDGTIKVWNAIVFSQVHEFIGHYNSVTGLVTHPTDPMLISSSKDGSLRVWRLDTFQLTQRIDVAEEILGMTVAHDNQIYYYTLHDVRVWNFNQFHHLFTPIQSCIHKLARIKSMRMPSRILCAAEDGSVRLVSAVSGSVLTIVYPMATYQVHTDIVYDPLGRRIYTALNSGDVLVFDASTNPCYAKELWIPPIPEEFILCLALVKLDCALGYPETMRCESLIFAGNNGGQILLMEARTSFMKESVQGHGGAILALECSHGTLHGGATSAVGSADRVISSGSDKKINIWEVFRLPESENEIGLISLCSISCPQSPSHISMMSNSLCTALPTNNTILVYEIIRAGQRKSSVNGSREQQEIKKYRHLKDHDHTKKISGLCCCPMLGLFASSSSDGSVKVWDRTNTLVKELCFDPTLSGVCFANDHGDLVVGFQNHVSYVSVTSYLPYSHLEKLPAMDFIDEDMEEPLPFNPDHQLWFDIDDLPVFPTNLQSRRRYLKKLSHYIQACSSLKIDTHPCRTTGSTHETSTEESILTGSERVGATPSPPSGELVEVEKSTEKAVDRKLSEEVPEKEDSLESPEGTAQPASPAASVRSSESHMTAESSTSEGSFVWPIAPDGYIPNSVLRVLMGYRYSPPLPPSSPWALKMIPLPEETEEEGELEQSYEAHEPFVWASSSEESLKLDSPTSDEGIVPEAFPPVIPVTPGGVGRRSVEDHKMKLRSLGTALPKLIPIPTFEPAQAIDKSATGRKPKRKGRGINLMGGTVQRRTRRQSQLGPGLGEAEEESDESDIDEFDEDGLGLLQRLAQEKWFPPNIDLDVESFVRALLLLLETTRDALYQTVCNAIIDIYKEYGFPDKLKEDTLYFFDERLSSPRGTVRASAVRVLTQLGANRDEVILKLIPKLVDQEEKVRVEAVTAVEVLAGIRNKGDLSSYLARIGLFKPYRNEDAAVLVDLSERYTGKPHPVTPHLHASLQSQMRAHRHCQAVRRNKRAEREGQGIYQERSGHSLSTWDHTLPSVMAQHASDQAPGRPTRGQRIMKKQRKRVDRPVRRKPPSQPMEGGTPGEEGDYGEEVGDEQEDMEEAESDFDYQSEELEDISRVVQFDAVSVPHSADGGGQRLMTRRLTIHDTMLEARAAVLANEKKAMVLQAQVKLRHHRDRYKKMMQDMSQRALQRKKILPVNPFYWRYYGATKTRTDKGRMKKSAPWLASSYGSIPSLDTELRSSLTSLSHRYSAVREEVAATQRSSSEDLHSTVDAAKELVMPITSHKTMNSSSYQAESGFAESTVLTSTVKFSDTADGRTLETYGSSGVYTDSLAGSIQIKGLKSKIAKPKVKVRAAESPHPLTMANLKRHEHLSARRGKKESLRAKKHNQLKLAKAETAIEEWRRFLQEQGRRKPAAEKGLLDGARGLVILPRIPRGIPMVQQGGKQRLLYCVAAGENKSNVKYPPHKGYFGSSDYGNMNMIWTNLSPAYHLKQRAGTPPHPTVSLSSLELTTTPGGGITHREVPPLETYLQQSLPGRLDAVNRSDTRFQPTRELGPVYEWKKPEPVILPSIHPNLEPVDRTPGWTTDTDRLDLKVDDPVRLCDRRPVVDPACTPIVPRNSTILSTSFPPLSPAKLKTLC